MSISRGIFHIHPKLQNPQYVFRLGKHFKVCPIKFLTLHYRVNFSCLVPHKSQTLFSKGTLLDRLYLPVSIIKLWALIHISVIAFCIYKSVRTDTYLAYVLNIVSWSHGANLYNFYFFKMQLCSDVSQ